MEKNISSLRSLRIFLDLLSDEQLDQPIRISPEDSYTINVSSVEIIKCDYINPSGDAVEPITDYMEGGEFYDPDFDPKNEIIVAKAGDIFFYAD